MEVLDQLGRIVEVPEDPQRIISLVPSQTELLADLHLDSRVVGITRFCERPMEWFYHKARIGGTKDIDLERINALKPDLIIGNFEENTREAVHALEHLYPVWISDVKDFPDALKMIREIGNLTARQDTAKHLAENIERAFKELPIHKSRPRVLYLIWKDPFMAVARNTFIHSMLEMAGFENALNEKYERYPALTEEEISSLQPDFIFLSTEPYPFKMEHAEDFTEKFQIRTQLVDGVSFSWFGSRLLHSPIYFTKLRKELQL